MCISFANTDLDACSQCNVNCYSNSHGNNNAYAYSYTQSDADAEGYSNTKASPYFTVPPQLLIPRPASWHSSYGKRSRMNHPSPSLQRSKHLEADLDCKIFVQSHK